MESDVARIDWGAEGPDYTGEAAAGAQPVAGSSFQSQMPTLGFSPRVEQALARASRETGVPVETLRAFTRIESGGNPRTRTGSYNGLLQLSNSQFRQYGGTGSIYDADQNAIAGARKIAALSAEFREANGRNPNAAELYMMHQQGPGGAAAHYANPDRPAWQNMLSTGEGQQRGAGWAKRAIWGNVPSDVRGRFGSVNNITSRDFTELWADKVRRFGAGDVAAPKASEPNAFAPVPAQTVPAFMDGGRDLPPMAAAPSGRQMNAFAGPKWGQDHYGGFVDWADRSRSYT